VLISTERPASQTPVIASPTIAAIRVAQTPVIASTTAQAATGELMYGNGELPSAFDGEAEGFRAFVQVHGYVPPTREVLIQWAKNSQGGA
jgi:hypothetical protein